MRIHHPLRTGKPSLAVCLAAACLTTGGLALTAGCSAAPAGAINNSPPIGPVKTTTTGLANFPPFPVPTKWAGADGKDYVMVVKAKTGTKRHVFSFKATSSVVFWLNCIGKGTARLTSPAMRVNWGVPCGTGVNPGGITVTTPHAAQGALVKAQVISPPGTRWEIRVDVRPAPKTA